MSEQEQQNNFTNDPEAINLLFTDPSTGAWIPQQKIIYENDIEAFSNEIINCFEGKIGRRYNEQLVTSVQNGEVIKSNESIDREYKRVELSILKYIFEDVRCSFPAILRIPDLKIPELWTFQNEVHDVEFTEEILHDLRSFYKQHIVNNIPLDYTLVPIHNRIWAPPDLQLYCNWVWYGGLIAYYKWILDQTKDFTNKKPPPMSINDIWIPDESGNYDKLDKLISLLAKMDLTTNLPFLSKKDNRYYWNRSLNGPFKYLRGLLFVLMNAGLIESDKTAPQLKTIVNNSFNAGVGSTTHFKSILADPPDKKYLSPFQRIISQI